MIRKFYDCDDILQTKIVYSPIDTTIKIKNRDFETTFDIIDIKIQNISGPIIPNIYLNQVDQQIIQDLYYMLHNINGIDYSLFIRYYRDTILEDFPSFIYYSESKIIQKLLLVIINPYDKDRIDLFNLILQTINKFLLKLLSDLLMYFNYENISNIKENKETDNKTYPNNINCFKEEYKNKYFTNNIQYDSIHSIFL